MDPEASDFNPHLFQEAEVVALLEPLARKRLRPTYRDDAGLVTIQAIRAFDAHDGYRFWPYFCWKIKTLAIDAYRLRTPGNRSKFRNASLQFAEDGEEAKIPAPAINVDAGMTMMEILRFIDTLPRIARWTLRSRMLANWNPATTSRVLGFSHGDVTRAYSEIRITRFNGRLADARRMLSAG